MISISIPSMSDNLNIISIISHQPQKSVKSSLAPPGITPIKIAHSLPSKEPSEKDGKLKQLIKINTLESPSKDNQPLSMPFNCKLSKKHTSPNSTLNTQQMEIPSLEFKLPSLFLLQSPPA